MGPTQHHPTSFVFKNQLHSPRNQSSKHKHFHFHFNFHFHFHFTHKNTLFIYFFSHLLWREKEQLIQLISAKPNLCLYLQVKKQTASCFCFSSKRKKHRIKVFLWERKREGRERRISIYIHRLHITKRSLLCTRPIPTKKEKTLYMFMVILIGVWFFSLVETVTADAQHDEEEDVNV